MVDVPPKLSAKVRVLSSGNSRKNDGLDALATALAASRNERLAAVDPEAASEVLIRLRDNTTISVRPNAQIQLLEFQYQQLPSDLWTIKFAATIAGLSGASVVTNFLIGFDLEVQTGLLWRHYLDGNLFGTQHVETDIAWTLNLKVEATAQAVTQFYDKAAADTMDFIRLKATGGPLGGTNYSSQIDLPVLYEEPEVIGDEDEGVNLYNITARLAYDATSGTSIVPVTVTSLAALP